MKKILTIILLSLAVGSAIWYIRRNGDFQSPVDQPLNEEGVLPPLTESVAPASQGDLVEKPDLLKIRALEIVSRPILVKIPISESSKKSALAKIEEITNLIKGNYDYANAWYDLGAYRMVIGDYEGAIDAYKFVNLIRPDDYIGYANLGDIYGFYLKNYPMAESNFLEALQKNPAYIPGYAELALLYENNFEDGRKKAENLLLAGLKANPEDAYLKDKLAKLYEGSMGN